MSHLITHEPSSNLEDLIMKRIMLEEKKRAVRGISVFSVFSVFSLWGSFSLGQYLWSAFYTSGFVQFASLAF